MRGPGDRLAVSVPEREDPAARKAERAAREAARQARLRARRRVLTRLLGGGGAALGLALLSLAAVFTAPYEGEPYMTALLARGDAAELARVAGQVGVGLAFSVAAFLAGRTAWQRYEARAGRSLALVAVVLVLAVVARLFWAV